MLEVCPWLVRGRRRTVRTHDALRTHVANRYYLILLHSSEPVQKCTHVFGDKLLAISVESFDGGTRVIFCCCFVLWVSKLSINKCGV